MFDTEHLRNLALKTNDGFLCEPALQAADEIAALQARVAELEAANRGLVRLNETTEARAEAADARLATVLQLVTHAATELAQSAQDMSAIRAERALHKAIRALADDPETIARPVAQLKEGRG